MIHNTEIATDSAETAALVVTGPQPVWMTLNQAREHAFTGELVFAADPEVQAYLDDGVVYYAERAGDAPLGQRLLDAGVVDSTQLERGMVRIGDLEHLGRLFDRDPSIDRDGVIVMAEFFTEELITELANHTTADVRVTAYRHHPSGLHRWFVAPVDRTVMHRPLSTISQLDGTVVDDLPSLPYGLEEDELMIEWDVIVATDAGAQTDADESEAVEAELSTDQRLVDEAPIDEAPIDETDLDETDLDETDLEETDLDAFELSLDLAEFTDAEDGEEIEPPEFEFVPFRIDDIVTPELDVSETERPGHPIEASEDRDDFEFMVVWPDGSEEQADLPIVDLDRSHEVEPAFTETEGGDLHFSMPALMLSDEPEAADAEVSDDVAAAVRRAIAAIESASIGGDLLAEVDPIDTEVELSDMEVAEIEFVEIEVTEIEVVEIGFAEFDVAEIETDEVVAEDATAIGNEDCSDFAPPTMAMRAEVLYGQMSEDGAVVLSGEPSLPPRLDNKSLSTDTGSTEIAIAGSAAEATVHRTDASARVSALHRLIGSLRRKDH